MNKKSVIKNTLRKSMKKKELKPLNKPFIPQGYTFAKEKVKYYHPGKWFMCDSEGLECYSCCMNENKDSIGCIKEKISGGASLD